MSVTFTGPSHGAAEHKVAAPRPRHSSESAPADVILGITIGVLVWATIAAMAFFALRLM